MLPQLVALSSESTLVTQYREGSSPLTSLHVRLGILEKFNINSPVKWLSRMLVTMKKDRSPRRGIDYKKLNDSVPRQTNITQSPFKCASACLPRKKKSILDASDGYHSVRR